MIRSLLILAAMLLLPAAAFAQGARASVSVDRDRDMRMRDTDHFGPAAGNWEFTLSGGGTNDNDFETGNFQINASIGYFYSPELEVLLRQSVTYADDNSGTVWRGATQVALDYHFNLGAWRPFVGVNFGGEYGDGDDTMEAGPEAGVKWFVNRTTFIYGMVQYEWFFKDIGDADNNADDGRFIYSLGIGFLF